LFGKLTQEFYRKKIFRDHKTNHPATQNIVMAALQTTLEQTLHFGESASNELNLFIQCFKPMTEKTASGLKLLKNGFRLADPNGNGMCSLAELDCFVKTQLLSIYPENQGKVAKELYKYYRPCYIRAYNDAKDYKKDDGTVIAGTEDCTADDFVSKGEFRLFCAYLCIYAAMVIYPLFNPLSLSLTFHYFSLPHVITVSVTHLTFSFFFCLFFVCLFLSFFLLYRLV